MSTFKEERAEESAYAKWQREKKNTILSMTNVDKKQAKWNELFPVFDLSDDWMLEAKVF